MTYGNYPDWSKIKKVLVVKMRHHGDVLLTTPLFSALKKHHPHLIIDTLIYEETRPMLEGHPAIDQILSYDRGWKKLSFIGRLARELSLLKKVRGSGYDLVFNLTEGDRGAIVSYMFGASYRVGMEKQGGSFWHRTYTHYVKQGPHPRHTVEKQLDFLRSTGVFPALDERELFVDIPTASRERVVALASNNFILIHPTSRWQFKCLSVSQVVSVIKGLHAKGHKIVLSSGPDEKERAMIEKILKLTPGIAVCDLGGKLSLKDLAALVERAKVLLCVDSLPLHLASALKTPVVVPFGPTSEEAWGPWQHPKARIITQSFSCRPCYKDGCGGSKMSDCLFSIDPKKIIEAIFELIT